MPAVPSVAGLCLAVLVASISVGVHIPGLGLLDRLPEGAGVDYADPPAGIFAPLRDAYVERVLGRSVPSTRAPNWAGSRQRPISTAAGGDLPDRVSVHHPLTNDEVDRAYLVPSVPFTARTDTRDATHEAGEPTACSSGASVWYRYTPSTDIGLLANTFGSGYALALGVYTRAGDAWSLVAEGCERDVAGDAQVDVDAEAGTTYFFQIASTLVGGELVFNLELQGMTTRASVSSARRGGNHMSFGPSISSDGRLVMFMSAATNLGAPWRQPPGCTDADAPTGANEITALVACIWQVYIRDRQTHTTTMVSVSPDGEPGRGLSYTGTISDDGRTVSFASSAANLVAHDDVRCADNTIFVEDGSITNSCTDIFVRDLATGAITMVSVSSSHGGQRGEQGDRSSFRPWMSGDGRVIAFESTASNLVPDDTNGERDVFVHDRATQTTARASVSDDEQEARSNGSSRYPNDRGSNLIGMSRNGRFVMFRSAGSELVHDDLNGSSDAFVRDLFVGTTERVSVPDRACTRRESDGDTLLALGAQWTVSDDGRFALFNSTATNLVCGDDGAPRGGDRPLEGLYLRDLVAGTTRRIVAESPGERSGSVPELDLEWTFVDALFTADGQPATELNYSISPDGRYVAFSSSSPSLDEDRPGFRDVFVHDTSTRETTLVSQHSSGAQADGASNQPSISADGRTIAFQSKATNLADDANGVWDIYVREIPGNRPFSRWH